MARHSRQSLGQEIWHADLRSTGPWLFRCLRSCSSLTGGHASTRLMLSTTHISGLRHYQLYLAIYQRSRRVTNSTGASFKTGKRHCRLRLREAQWAAGLLSIAKAQIPDLAVGMVTAVVVVLGQTAADTHHTTVVPHQATSEFPRGIVHGDCLHDLRCPQTTMAAGRWTTPMGTVTVHHVEVPVVRPEGEVVRAT